MLNIDALDLDLLRFNYSAPITAGDFDVTDFHSNPSGFAVDTITQDGAAGLQLLWETDVSHETNYTYDGDVPGVLTPQTVGI
ncbi:MAG: hypothetical protein WAP47_01635 [Candidatus Rokuibacteriota bacterium]